MAQSIAMFTKVPKFLEDVYILGRDRGFKDGYDEGVKMEQRRVSKLN